MLKVVLGGGVLRESRGWYETKHDDGCTVAYTLPVFARLRSGAKLL